jgi:transcriptional regulator with XRE-family HTH domain
LTQADLADRVALGRTSIVNIERGHQRVHLHTVIALAAALQVPPTELFPEEPDETTEIPPQLQKLPVAERDWVMRRLASPTTDAARQGSRRDSSS